MELANFYLFFAICALSGVVAPPVIHNKTANAVDSKENEVPKDDFGVEYNRYLEEVVQALESDPQFREKLKNAEDADIRSGKIAHELEFVSHAVRTRLDEVKRSEMERLRHYARRAYELSQGLDTNHLGIPSAPNVEHIDHSNPETFEIEDLRKLIFKTTSDLAEADKKRREEFKEYEMQKEFEKNEKLKNMTEEEKKKFQVEVDSLEKKHKEHAPLHHPISKPQLEEVWEKSDHMENQQFDPKTFFYLHDLDGNHVWDYDEVKALFLKELDKMYQAGAPEDDMRERVEEMERMREHVFQEADTNRDGLISYEEFLAQTQKADFNSDPGWETLDQQQKYTQEEYEKFEMQRRHEIEAMIASGHLPPHAANMPYAGHPQQQQHYQGHPAQGQHQYPPPQQFHGQPQHQQFQAQPQQFHGQPQHQQFQAQPQQVPGQPQHQQFQAQPQQVHGQTQHQQVQAQPQQFHGQPQQFQAPPSQFQGHPEYHGQPQVQGQQQQFQAPPQQYHAPPPPQPIHQGSPDSHIASQQAASAHQSGQASPGATHNQQQLHAQPAATNQHQQVQQANSAPAAHPNSNNVLNNDGQPIQAAKHV